jgi:hypothetical protein
MRNTKAAAFAALALGAAAIAYPAITANAVGNDQGYQAPANNAAGQTNTTGTYSPEEIVQAGQTFFGNTTKGVAQAVESVFAQAGRPTGYIIGEEAAGAFIGGLRYGEGTLYMKNGGQQKVYWQGPSVGFDWGGNGSRVLVLVYNIGDLGQIYDRFIGIDGSAYLIGGLGVNWQTNQHLQLAPIRTGVGARLGANVGYLKYTERPTWNPF